jgi:hypothetical protein
LLNQLTDYQVNTQAQEVPLIPAYEDNLPTYDAQTLAKALQVSQLLQTLVEVEDLVAEHSVPTVQVSTVQDELAKYTVTIDQTPESMVYQYP